MALEDQGLMPDRLVMFIDGRAPTKQMAYLAVERAQEIMPKLTGRAAAGLMPVWDEGVFGIRWRHYRVWYQERGIHPFTMSSLAGKTIPMWIDDPTGSERQKNPRAQVRTTASGRVQVLIFRRAARQGERKNVRRGEEIVSVPKSFPGAPGRIGLRQARRPDTRPGKVGGQISRFNVGVRWRHPGLAPRNFLHRAMAEVCESYGIEPPPPRPIRGMVT